MRNANTVWFIGAALNMLRETSRLKSSTVSPVTVLDRSGSSFVMTSRGVFSRKSVSYMKAGMRVANLISFSWICFRLPSYSFSSSDSSFLSFGVRSSPAFFFVSFTASDLLTTVSKIDEPSA